MIMPSVVLPSAGAGALDSEAPWPCSARFVLEAARAASKSVGASGMEHIITSRIGLELQTRLGQITTVRLWASMRFH